MQPSILHICSYSGSLDANGAVPHMSDRHSGFLTGRVAAGQMGVRRSGGKGGRDNSYIERQWAEKWIRHSPPSGASRERVLQAFFCILSPQ